MLKWWTAIMVAVLVGGGATAPTSSATDHAARGGEPAVMELELADQRPDMGFLSRVPVIGAWWAGVSARTGSVVRGTDLDPVLRTGALNTGPFTVLGLSWQAPPAGVEVTIRYRTASADLWTPWQVAGPGEGSMPAGRVNTDAIVLSPADHLEVVATTTDGAIEELKAVIIDPGVLAQDASASTVTVASVARPSIISRAQWGADESLRTCTPEVTTEIVSAAVHHTVSTNTYSADEAAGVVRGIYLYHTRSAAAGGRGWCDIGYNALVDRFGRIYEGRGGSFDGSIVGVHTGGFNSRTFGISVIGNYQVTEPPAEVIEGVAQAIAWKFATERILAGTTVSMVSGGGASKYSAGTVVSLPTVYGHRDAQLTACPGERLYVRLNEIRGRVAQLSNASVNASPMASWDRTSGGTESVTVTGWGFDPDSDESLVVDVVVDGTSHTALADVARPDVAAAYPGVGSAHGFLVTVPLTSGRHVVCLWLRNVGDGNDHLLGCRAVSVVNAPPAGFVDDVVATPSGVLVAGWALDADAEEPIAVHVYVDGTFGGAVVAQEDRADIAAAYPAQGGAHGFALAVPTGAGRHTVCAYAINVPTGANPALGCRVVTVVNTAPQGFLDMVASSPSGVQVMGWALDTDTAESVAVHVYVNGTFAGSVRADQQRADIAAAFPAQGGAHGYSLTVPTGAGTLRVCVYAINAPMGSNPALGCRTVNVVNATPVGFVDEASATAAGVRVSGWALDTDAGSPVDVHLYVDGVFGATVNAREQRADIAAAFPAEGGAHGFSTTLAVGPGSHTVCGYAINAPTGANPSVGCRVVMVGEAP